MQKCGVVTYTLDLILLMLVIIPFDTDNTLFTNSIADISSVMVSQTGKATDVFKPSLTALYEPLIQIQ